MDYKNNKVLGSAILKAWNDGRQAEKLASEKRDKQSGTRAYAGAKMNRLAGEWSVLNTSADSEIVTSLRPLRARSRQLVRDNEFAKNAVRIVQTNVIGGGIGMQGQVTNAKGKLIDKVNNQIEAAWATWTDRKYCHTAGVLGFQDLERIIMAQIVEAGEVLIRKVKQPFGEGTIPFALEAVSYTHLTLPTKRIV